MTSRPSTWKALATFVDAGGGGAGAGPGIGGNAGGWPSCEAACSCSKPEGSSLHVRASNIPLQLCLSRELRPAVVQAMMRTTEAAQFNVGLGFGIQNNCGQASSLACQKPRGISHGPLPPQGRKRSTALNTAKWMKCTSGIYADLYSMHCPTPPLCSHRAC